MESHSSIRHGVDQRNQIIGKMSMDTYQIEKGWLRGKRYDWGEFILT